LYYRPRPPRPTHHLKHPLPRRQAHHQTNPNLNLQRNRLHLLKKKKKDDKNDDNREEQAAAKFDLNKNKLIDGDEVKATNDALAANPKSPLHYFDKNHDDKFRNKEITEIIFIQQVNKKNTPI